MSQLEQLAAQRLSGQLPTFFGNTLEEKLFNGRRSAEAALRKYRPDFKFDEDQARRVNSEVNGWVTRHEEELEEAMQSPDTQLPAYLMLNMGSAEKVQQWVIAQFTVAAAGMGPWLSGRVRAEVANPSSEVSQGWAEQDGDSRLRAFAMIVKMDEGGELDAVFNPQQAVQGLGVAPAIVVAIVVTVIGLAAVVVSFLFLDRRLARNNQLMRDICEKAQREGDQATVQMCIESTKELQAQDPFQSVAAQLGKVALLLAGGYLAIKVAIPALLEGFKEDR